MRLIDADALEGRILMDVPGFMDGGSEITKAFILAMIKTRSVTPTVDAIPVVRCKDCAKYDRNTGICSDGIKHGCAETWFCGDGKRKEGEENGIN